MLHKGVVRLAIHHPHLTPEDFVLLAIWRKSAAGADCTVKLRSALLYPTMIARGAREYFPNTCSRPPFTPSATSPQLLRQRTGFSTTPVAAATKSPRVALPGAALPPQSSHLPQSAG